MTTSALTAFVARGQKYLTCSIDMTASELKYNVEQGHDRYFFTRDSMRFFGDTMRNYGVRDGGTTWKLYRRHPVKHGFRDSAYFDKATFKRVFDS